MAGALLGAINGADWLDPIARRLEDSSYIRDLAWRVANQAEEPLPLTETWTRGVSTRFWREISSAGLGAEIRLPDGRDGTVMSVVEHPSRVRSLDARTWVVRTADRQTLHLKHVRRLSAASAPSRTEPDVRARIGVVLAVADLRRSLEFYRDVIGLPV
jgi:hypothetical protein